MAKFCATKNYQSIASITARLITQDLDKKKTLDYYEKMFLLNKCKVWLNHRLESLTRVSFSFSKLHLPVVCLHLTFVSKLPSASIDSDAEFI